MIASPVYHVRDIIAMSREQVAQLPLHHTVQFDDGEQLAVFLNETMYSHLFWEIFRVYDKTRILKKHHVSDTLGDECLNTDTHAKLCSKILRSVVEDQNLFLPKDKEPLLALIYRCISDAMSQLSIWSEESVTSIDILDFIQIAAHPTVQSLRQEAMAVTAKIKYAYESTIKLIESEPQFLENGLAKAMRSKMVKANQVVQCVCFRGIATEVDGAIFPKPIWSNYTEGMTKFYDFVADSRTAAKSHFYSDTALKDSEYMGRKFQLFATVLERIVYNDCQSTKHVMWQVRGEERDKSGTITYPGDLPFLIGKYYLEEGSQAYKWIEGNEKHLIGKKIQLRSVLYCKEKDPHAVCHICAGKLSENISQFANLGHLGSITTTKETTQNILSIKHVNTSSTVTKILLGDHERKYLNTGINSDAFYLNDTLKDQKPQITVLRDEAVGLVDLTAIDEVDQISLPRISQITAIRLITVHKKLMYDTQLNVSQKDKASMMSREFLHYLKTHSWQMDDDNNFVFDMEEWDYKKPLFIMQSKEESYVDLANQIDKMVHSSQKMVQKRLVKDAATILLKELFDLVNSKLRVNILSFEAIVYALMVESPTSYALSRESKEPVLGVAELLTKFRSLGAALAYEDQHETVSNAANFYQGRRPDSPMDAFYAPKEVVAEYKIAVVTERRLSSLCHCN